MAQNPDDVVRVQIVDEDPKVEEHEAQDSEEIDNSLTPFEKMAQKLLDNLRTAYNLDPSGEIRSVAVVLSLDNGKTWKVVEDSSENDVYVGQEIWSKAYVEAEVTKVKTAFPSRASPV